MSNSTDMTTVFRTRSYGSFIKVKSSLRRKNVHRMNQGSHFLESSFSNRDSVRAPIQFRRERQSQHQFFKKMIFKNRSIRFCINSTRVVNCSNEPSLVFPALKSTIHFLPQSIVSIGQIQVQKPTLVAATNH